MMTSTLGFHKRSRRFCTASSLMLPVAALGIALLGSGCGEVEYGPPTVPTATQLRAISALHEVASRTARASEGRGDAAELIAVHPLVASLADEALLLPTGGPTSSKSLVLTDPSCVRGDQRTGFVFGNCASDGGTLEGQVKLSPSAVEYDLRVLQIGSPLDTNLEGTLSVQNGQLNGILEHSISSSETAYDQGSGSGQPVGMGGPKTWVYFDVVLDGKHTCIESGAVRVQVQAWGGEQNARFRFSGCDRVTAENSL